MVERNISTEQESTYLTERHTITTNKKMNPIGFGRSNELKSQDTENVINQQPQTNNISDHDTAIDYNTVIQPNIVSTILLHYIIMQDKQTITLRLVLPFVTSIMMTILDYNMSIVLMVLIHSLLIISLIAVTSLSKQNHKDQLEVGWLEFLLSFMGRYFPTLATNFRVISIFLGVAYIFVSELALCTFTVCFVKLCFTIIING